MWLPLFPWGSNIASSKPVNLRKDSMLSTVPLSSQWPSRGMSSLCRIMIFFHVRTFTLWNGWRRKDRKNYKPRNSASFRLRHQLLKITTLKVPGPELLAGRLRTFHTHNARLPRHAESWQAQLLGPLQDVLPLCLVVDVVTVDPQSAEHFLRSWRRLFPRGWCCCQTLINEELQVVFHPVHSKEHTHFPLAVFCKVRVECCVELRLLGPAKASTPMAQKRICYVKDSDVSILETPKIIIEILRRLTFALWNNTN